MGIAKNPISHSPQQINTILLCSLIQHISEPKMNATKLIRNIIIFPNVPGQESPLASGMASARVAESAGGMPEVPQGQGFDGPVR